ncbi:MAG: YfiR family protein, partial [Gammaproteobacteria bacterium]|nr:YfiR family protein [Gammaproteobacteria bacterium]
PVLTIGETESFTEEGGMISLVEKNGLLDIVFNPDAAEHAQLKVDESLLLDLLNLAAGIEE